MNIYAATWTVVAAIGVGVSAYLLIEAIVDLRALGTLQNGRRALVRGRLASESVRLIVHAAFLALGVSLLAQEIRGSPTVLVLISGNIGMILTSFISVYVWRVVETPDADPLTAEDLVAQAEETADALLLKAEESARDLVELARRTARELDRVELERSLSRERAR